MASVSPAPLAGVGAYGYRRRTSVQHELCHGRRQRFVQAPDRRRGRALRRVEEDVVRLVRVRREQRLLRHQQEERRERPAHGTLPQHVVAHEEAEEAERVREREVVERHQHAHRPTEAVVHAKPHLLILARAQDRLVPGSRDADAAHAFELRRSGRSR
eukprot:scaffold73517_cov63-Phaeocystis_antarctica.AAC.1